MGKLLAQCLGVVAVSLLTGVACGLVGYVLVGRDGVVAAAWAIVSALPAACIATGYLHRHGVQPGAMVAASLLRVALTSAAAGVFAGVIPALRSAEFFLSVGVIYLANLAVETWFAWQHLQREMLAARRETPTVKPPEVG